MLGVLRDGMKYPTRFDKEMVAHAEGTPPFGSHVNFSRQVKQPDGTMTEREIMLTDTQPCGMGPRVNPLVAGVSPNSTRHFNAIPQWMRITLTHTPHRTVIMVLDALATPIWEDEKLAKAIPRLCSVLLSNEFTVLFAVTKLHASFLFARTKQSGGTPPEGTPLPDLGSGALSCYETYVQRYLSRICATIQANARRYGYPLGDPEAEDFPRVGKTLFDVVTFKSAGDFAEMQKKRCTTQLPNFLYAQNQIEHLFKAATGPRPYKAPKEDLLALGA